MDRRKFISTVASAAASTIIWPSPVQAAPKPHWKIGIYTRPWAKHDYRIALDAIAETGFLYAGLMTHKGGLLIGKKTRERTAAKIGAEAHARGLEIISVYGGDFNAEKSIKAGIRGLKNIIDNVAACNGQNVLLGGTGSSSVFNNYYKAVRETCDYAAQQNVALTIKPHGGLNATGPQCQKIVDMVGHPNFQLWYDAGNIYYYSDGELDPVIDVDSAAGRIAGMCVKDYLHPKNVMVTPGKGIVKFPALFKKLKSGGFVSGPLVIECLSEGSLAHINKEALSAKKYLEQIVTGN